MVKTKINPTFLTQSTTPKVNVRLMGSNAIEFTVEGSKIFYELCRRHFLEKLFAEDVERLTDAWIFINFLTKNTKIIERQLEWDDERGLWRCQYRDSALKPFDIFEYWTYVEKNGYGYFSSEVLNMEGK